MAVITIQSRQPVAEQRTEHLANAEPRQEAEGEDNQAVRTAESVRSSTSTASTTRASQSPISERTCAAKTTANSRLAGRRWELSHPVAQVTHLLDTATPVEPDVDVAPIRPRFVVRNTSRVHA